MTRRLPAALAALAVVLAACSHEAPPPSARPRADRISRARPPPPAAAPVAHAEDPEPKGALTARSIQQHIEVWKRYTPQERPTWTFDTRNPVGESLAMLVTGERTDDAGTDWLRILIADPAEPGRRLGARGRRGPRARCRTGSRSTSPRARWSTSTGTSSRHRFEVGIGQPQWPTATGTFYIWAHVPQASPTGPYGVYALGLSGFSEVLTNWPGGGRMAIHGTPYASNRGEMVSHGCIRVFNPDMQKLKRVPLGTPVLIRR